MIRSILRKGRKFSPEEQVEATEELYIKAYHGAGHLVVGYSLSFQPEFTSLAPLRVSDIFMAATGIPTIEWDYPDTAMVEPGEPGDPEVMRKQVLSTLAGRMSEAKFIRTLGGGGLQLQGSRASGSALP